MKSTALLPNNNSNHHHKPQQQQREQKQMVSLMGEGCWALFMGILPNSHVFSHSMISMRQAIAAATAAAASATEFLQRVRLFQEHLANSSGNNNSNGNSAITSTTSSPGKRNGGEWSTTQEQRPKQQKSPENHASEFVVGAAGKKFVFR